MYRAKCGTKNDPDHGDCIRCGTTDGDSDKLLTSKDVAKMLGVSVAYVKDHCTRAVPRIPLINLGTKKRATRRFRRDEVLKFIEFNARAGHTGPLR